jgi:hypothetical protein
VDLPVLPPLELMLAKAPAKVPPEAEGYSYKPKWDSFRHRTCVKTVVRPTHRVRVGA